ncbi:hypothetical protein [Nocardia sp. CA-145437]|uniref:hypothetical protein n=1 Tax=Nocardia sp. CA-145437 TaxID=3239980 RepID=UPI003D97D50B
MSDDTRAAASTLAQRITTIAEDQHELLRDIDRAGADKVVEMLVAAAQEIQRIAGAPALERGEGDY